PFVNVSRLLTNVPLPIPTIAGHAGDLGILILEDLGDVTLQAHLGVTQPIEHDALYKQAVELVERLQRRGRELESSEFIPFGVAFDRDKLMWEQRNLKALGTFGHQTTSRHNPVYIQYIPRTLSYVRTNLERYPRFARLRELLGVLT